MTTDTILEWLQAIAEEFAHEPHIAPIVESLIIRRTNELESASR